MIFPISLAPRPIIPNESAIPSKITSIPDTLYDGLGMGAIYLAVIDNHPAESVR